MTKTIAKVTVGSHLYGCADEDSDKDSIVVVIEDLDDLILRGRLKNFHSIDKEADTDIKTTSLVSLMKALLKGSPESLPVLWAGFEESHRVWGDLLAIRTQFVTQQSVRCLLAAAGGTLRGVAASRGMGVTVKPKKLSAAFRWVLDAENMLITRQLLYPIDGSNLDDYMAIRKSTLSVDESIDLIYHRLEKADHKLKSTFLPESANLQMVQRTVCNMYKEVWGEA